MKNLVMLSLITCLSFGMNAENIPVNNVALLPTINSTGNPEAVFHEVRVEHNEMNDGQKGMKIHVNFNVNHIIGRSCQILAYFYKHSGEPLEDRNLEFRTRTGEVCTPGKQLNPGYDMTWYKDLTIFMPYDELHVNGRQQLKFKLSVFYDGRFIGHSRFNAFTINWTSTNPTPGNCLDIDGTSVFRQVNSALNDLKIRLDKEITISMGNRLLYSYHVGELKISKPGYDWYFYLRAINTTDIVLSAVGDKLRLKIKFEGDGSEVKGRTKKGLPSLRDKRVPDINWKGDKSFEFLFKPVVRNNSFTFKSIEAKMNGHLDIGGNAYDIGELFFGLETSLKKFLVDNLNKALENNSNVANPIADKIRPALNRLGINRFTSISVVGSKIRFCR